MAAFLVAVPTLLTASIVINYARQHTQINNGLASAVCQFFSFKQSVARNVAGRRIIITGFSNAMMGTRAERLQALLNAPVVNFGVNANSSDALVFEALAQVVRPGDVVILELPYWFFSTRDRVVGQESLIRSVSTSCPVNGLSRLPMRYSADFLLFQNPVETIEGLGRLLFDGWWFAPFRKAPAFEGVADRVASGGIFGRLGDYETHTRKRRTAEMQARIRSTPQNVKALTFDRDGEGLRQLKLFLDEAKENGVRVYAKWPVAYVTTPIDSAAIISDMRDLYAKYGIPVLGNPIDFQYPIDDFFDSANHLTKEASIVHATSVAQLIRDSGLLDKLKH